VHGDLPDKLPFYREKERAMKSFVYSYITGSIIVLITTSSLSAHHFKGLPHYNYFENYPQVPEEEFLGQEGDYEFSLVLYDFQGINRDNVEQPDDVRLFLVIFNLQENKTYKGALTLEIFNRGAVYYSDYQETSELENLYSLQTRLPSTGKYSLRVTLHQEDELQCVIPFRLSSQKIHWGKWITLILFLVIGVAAFGARKARIAKDRAAQAKARVQKSVEVVHG